MRCFLKLQVTRPFSAGDQTIYYLVVGMNVDLLGYSADIQGDTAQCQPLNVGHHLYQTSTSEYVTKLRSTVHDVTHFPFEPNFAIKQ